MQRKKSKKGSYHLKEKENLHLDESKAKSSTVRNTQWHNISLSGRILKDCANYTHRKNESSHYKQSNQEKGKSMTKSKSTIKIDLREKTFDQTFQGEVHQSNLAQDYYECDLSPQQTKRAHRQSSQKANNKCNLKQILTMETQEIRERERMKLEYISEIDRIEAEKSGLRMKYPEISEYWDEFFEHICAQKELSARLWDLTEELKELSTKGSIAKDALFQLTKQHLMQRNMRQYTSRGQKEMLLLDAENSHNQLKQKLSRGDFEEIITFNLKVLLPSRQKLLSPIKKNFFCPNSTLHQFTISEHLSHSNIMSYNASCNRLPQTKESLPTASMYEELFQQKASRKFAMIAKKHSLGPSQSKAVNEFLKKITQFETSYSKMDTLKTSNTESVDLFYSEMEKIVQEVDQIQTLIKVLSENKLKLEVECHKCQSILARFETRRGEYLSRMNQIIRKEYGQITANQKADFKELLRENYNKQFGKYSSYCHLKQQLGVKNKNNQYFLRELKQNVQF